VSWLSLGDLGNEIGSRESATKWQQKCKQSWTGAGRAEADSQACNTQDAEARDTMTYHPVLTPPCPAMSIVVDLDVVVPHRSRVRFDKDKLSPWEQFTV
jgi:hypothetical protein